MVVGRRMQRKMNRRMQREMMWMMIQSKITDIPMRSTGTVAGDEPGDRDEMEVSEEL